MKAVCVFAIVLSATAALSAQPEAADPLRCWWRTSAGAVAIGEPFDAALTCAVREQESSRTVPDESRLSAAVIQLAPFEVLGGAHPADLRTATHRFIQYRYTLRIIDSNVIGFDAKFPDLQIPYRVHTLTNGEWAQGRDRSYIMPGQPVRVLSLVPQEADDIRDSADQSFDAVARLRFRSRALQIAAVALVLLGGLVLVPAAVAFVRGGRSPDGAEAKAVSRRSIVAAIHRELAAVRHESRGGWTPDLAVRVLNALRLAASCALARDVAQLHVASDGIPTGRIAAPAGFLRRRVVALSSALTPIDVERAIAALPLTASHERRQLLAELLTAMNTMTTAIYGAAASPGTSYDESIDVAVSLTNRLRGQR
jgi:hypothetical protein